MSNQVMAIAPQNQSSGLAIAPETMINLDSFQEYKESDFDIHPINLSCEYFSFKGKPFGTAVVGFVIDIKDHPQMNQQTKTMKDELTVFWCDFDGNIFQNCAKLFALGMKNAGFKKGSPFKAIFKSMKNCTNGNMAQQFDIRALVKKTA